MYISYQLYQEQNLPKKARNKHDEEYIKDILKKEKDYFDNLFKKIDPNIKLDDNQRRIILNEEKYLMVVAGAGSGKTTTITAKVDYLINKKNIKDEEILVISFTNKAVSELDHRINTEMNHKVKITTFHKLGYEIIKKNKSNPPKILKEDIITGIIEKKLLNKKHRTNIVLKQQPAQKNKNNTKIVNLCKEYIALFKANGCTKKDLEKIKYKRKKEKQLKKLIDEIYTEYEETLKRNNNIDFDDMINYSKQIIKTTKQVKGLNYKYIIIDEYQDISESRFELVKEILKKTSASLMVVGDDWQCIYGFSASNINLFTKFEEYVGQCEVLKITETYRNSQELIDIAGKFIQENPKQIKKELKSKKALKHPITILKYKKNKEKEKFKEAINYIKNKYGKERNILILGRYNFDINRIIDEEIKQDKTDAPGPSKNTKIIYKNQKDIEIHYMTVHSSKGLGYDNVIIINSENKKLGFPSKIKTPKIISPLIANDKTIKYAEERRLFYVALTRTKNEVIILSPAHNPSIFVKQLKKSKNIEIKSRI